MTVAATDEASPFAGSYTVSLPPANPQQQQQQLPVQQTQEFQFNAEGLPQYSAAQPAPYQQPGYQNYTVITTDTNPYHHHHDAVIVHQRPSDEDCVGALVVFLCGFLCCCIWLAGGLFTRSPNPTTRLLGYASILMFVFACIIIIFVSIFTPTYVYV